MNKVRVCKSIESSFQRHSGGPQGELQSATKKRKADHWDIEAQDFIQRGAKWDRHDRLHVVNLRQFLNKNSVSLLALRGKDALAFLNILEQVYASRTSGPFPCKGFSTLSLMI